jgi:hypothetical protein
LTILEKAFTIEDCEVSGEPCGRLHRGHG